MRHESHVPRFTRSLLPLLLAALLAGCGAAAPESDHVARPGPVPVPTPTPGPAPAPSVSTLLWDGPTSGPTVSSYNVYIAADAAGTNYGVRGSTSDTEIALSSLGLTAGQTYWARVTSVGTSGLESAASEAISFTY